MKRIFKFFPVALAAIALASCSDNLDTFDKVQEKQLTNHDLVVQMDGDDATRSGYVTSIYDYSIHSALFFNEGDQMKLYHNATSWKPEVWTASEYGQYKNATGTAVFSNDDAEITTDEDAYGIYPANLAQFGNENRTSIQFDLTGLKFITYSADDQTFLTKDNQEKHGTAYAAPFPIWGVKAAGKSVMTAKHLAGILRLDIANVATPSAVGKCRYVIIQSAKKLNGVIKTANDLLLPTPAEEAKVPTANLMSQAPVLETEAASVVSFVSGAVPVTPATIGDDMIVVKVPFGAPEHLMVFVPLTPGMVGGDVKIYVSNEVSTADATIDETAAGTLTYTLTAEKIAEENQAQGKSEADKAATSVRPGIFYRINDDSSNINDEAKTPFQLAEGIIAADQAAYRDFEITFTKPIEVKNNDDSPQNFLLNLAGGEDRYGLAEGWALKHNVTVNLTLQESADAGSVPSVLYIRTKEGSKKLTLNIMNDANPIDRIEIEEGKLKSELVLKREAVAKALPNITVGKGNDDLVTIKSGNNATGSGNLITGSNIKIEIGAYNTVDRIKSLTLANGVKQVNIKDASIANINIAGGASAIANDVVINTESKVGINVVEYNNMPKTAGTAAGKSIDSYNLIFKSKWVAGTAASSAPATFTTTIIRDGATTINNCITTASELAAATTAGTDYTVVGEYDLDGTKSAWTSLGGLTANVFGAQYFRFSDAATRAITGRATVKNLKGENGLIASWTPAAATDVISNFTFDGTNKVEKAAGTKLGLLVGEVSTATAAGTIKNITLNGTNSIQDATVGKNAACIAIGGVIGKTSGNNALQLANVKVGANTNVYGFRYVGGIIGEVAGKVVFGVQKADGSVDKFANTAAVEAGDVKNVCDAPVANLHTILVAPAPMSPNLPTVGKFFGGASAIAADGDITILGGLTKLTTARTADNWGYYLGDKNSEYWSWQAYLNYDEIGHTGYITAVDGAGNNVVQVDGGIKAIYVLTENTTTHKYATTTKFVPYVGTAAPVDGTPAGTCYFGYVNKPY